MARYSLSEKEKESLKKWEDAHKEIFGEVGNNKITFSNGGGIGVGVDVTNSLSEQSKDITDYDSW